METQMQRRKKGRPSRIPGPKITRNIAMLADTLAMLEERAKAAGLPVSTLVEAALVRVYGDDALACIIEECLNNPN